MNLETLHEAKGKLATRRLGATGFKVPILSLGGQGSLETHGNMDNCVKIIRRAYELGLRYFDTAPAYGPSESYYGEALQGIRSKIFLACKTDERTRDGSLKLLEKSLKKLKTDHLDLWQIHHLRAMDEISEVTGKDGALQALIEMQEQKVVKHLGFTGHEDPKVLAEMAKRHSFDTVLCPINAADANMNPSFIAVVAKGTAQKHNLGVIGMKVFAQGFIFDKKRDGLRTVWEALTYSLSQPVSTVIVGMGSVAQLEENVAIAKSFIPLSAAQQKLVESKTKSNIRRACFFRKEFGGYNSRNRLAQPD